MKGYYSESYVMKMITGNDISLEWDTSEAQTAYVQFIEGKITIYQARAIIYSASLEDNKKCKIHGFNCYVHYHNSHFYTNSDGYCFFDYEKLMKECGGWLKKTKNINNRVYAFGSIKATLEWMNIIRPKLKRYLDILDVALGIRGEEAQDDIFKGKG